MKKFITVGLLLGFSTFGFANEGHKKKPQHPRKGMVVAVGGERAQAIFESLDVEVETKSGERGSADIKAVGGLKCIHFSNDEKEGFRCWLKGKPAKKRHPKGPKGPKRPDRD